MTHRLSALLAISATLASAQIAQPYNDTSILANKKVEVSKLDDLVYKVKFKGTIEDAKLASDVVSYAINNDITNGLSAWITSNANQLKGKGPQAINEITGFIITVNVTNDALEVQAAPQEVFNFGTDRNILGKTGVVIREFSDFECPYCREFHKNTYNTIKGYVKAGKARFSYRHLPLTNIHPKAYSAAIASECAAKQNKFFEYHDALFTKSFDLLARAKETKLNIDKFKTCMASMDVVDNVFKDAALSREINVNGTPSLFIGPFRVASYDPQVMENYLRMAKAYDAKP